MKTSAKISAVVPNPGSDEAIKKGCVCPVLDNGHGNGCGRKDDNGNSLFWITAECPMHGGRVKA